jgi:hypothetical protein
MATARLHDDALLDVAVLGDGPAVLLPVSTSVIDGEADEQIRAWGADPNLGNTLATSLADAGLRVIAADYEGHPAQHSKPLTPNALTITTDLLPRRAGGSRFAYYGYSWLALAGLQPRSAPTGSRLAMGGFPPLRPAARCGP